MARTYEIAFQLGAQTTRRFKGAFKEAGGAFSKLGKMGGIAGTAIASGMSVAIGAVGTLVNEMDTAFGRLEAQTGNYGKELSGLEDVAKNVFNNAFGESIGQVSKDVASLQSMFGDLNNEQMQTLAEGAYTISDLWGYEVKEVGRTVSTLTKTFDDLSSSDALDIITTSFQKTGDYSGDLLDTFNEYSTVFANLGYDAEGFAATLIAGAESGAFNMDKLADSAKEAFVLLGEGSDNTRNALSTMGLDANQIISDISSGGESAQQAFMAVSTAVGSIEDPAKRNQAAIAAFGTPLEDLGPQFATFFSSVNQDLGNFEGATQKAGNAMQNNLGTQIQKIFRETKTGIAEAFNAAGGQELLSGMVSQAQNFIPVIQNIITKAVEFSNAVRERWPAIRDTAINVFQGIYNFVQPVISAIAGFVGEKVAQIRQFWETDGAQILAAVQNVFGGIWSVIQFIMPAVLFLIQSVWNSIKGVITGALNIIMGVVRVFAGLFTGDFKKMWQGVQQLFIGAIQFIWNAINLMFVGRIIKAIKTFATNIGKQISGMWTNIKNFFTNGVTNIWNQMGNVISNVTNGFRTAKDKAIDLARNMWSGVQNQFTRIVDGAKALPGKIGQGIKSMAGKALDGIKSMGNTMLRGIGNIVNGVIGGLNWVLGKTGIDMTINEWNVPQYAKGTGAHPGGMAMVNDAKGSNYKEMVATPNGQAFIPQGRNVLMNLPKGSEVLSGSNTKKFMDSMNVPRYEEGTGGNWFTNSIGWVGDKIKGGAQALANLGRNIWSYISEPGKLFNKVLEFMGIGIPNLPGVFGNIAKGAFNFLKDSAIDFLEEKFDDLFSWSGSYSAGAGVQQWAGLAAQALRMTGQYSQANLNRMLMQMQTESGGNPNAINNWDINAKRGTPSKGLMQVS